MLFDSIGMCFERIQMHSGSMQCISIVCKSVLKVYHCILQAYMFILKACECFLKAYECNLRAYEYILRAYKCIWNVCDYRYVSSFNVIRTHKAAMAFHMRGHGRKIYFVWILFVGMTFGDVQV